jgi:hypothetical protein
MNKDRRLWLIVAVGTAFSSGWMLGDVFPHSPVLLLLAGAASIIAYCGLLRLSRTIP